METAVLSSTAAVDALRAALARRYVLWEPRSTGGAVDWARSDGTAPFEWSASRPLASPKQLFFPARESLLRWGEAYVAETLPDPDPFVVFGIHPCDLTAIAYQDRFFARDPWYRRRREAAFLIGIDCLTACPGGFCLDVDSGPFAHGGFDLNLTRLGDGRVHVAFGSGWGHDVLANTGLAAMTSDDDVAAGLAEAERAARASFPARPFISRAIARINAAPADGGAVRDEEWQMLGPSCLACSGCTSLCPTCSCFTVTDEPDARGGTRVRYWDSCLLEGFQREASGHHPAPRAGDRVRRFWEHKLSDAFARDFGRYGCVGCGRCDVTCPGTIGALGVLGRLGA
jgi:formate hydrogenlyase subunit 6/NADH:ubiquinone oxidoreductase subunit I